MFYSGYFSKVLFIAAVLLTGISIDGQWLSSARSTVEISDSSKVSELRKTNSSRIEELSKRAEADPTDWVAMNDLGVEFAARRHYTDALKALEKARTLRPNDAGVLYNLSIVYDNLGMLEEAIAAITRSVSLDPKNLLAIRQSCELQLLSRQYKPAVSCFESLIQQVPDDPVLTGRFVMSLISSNQIERAEREVEKGFARFPESPEVQNAQGLVFYYKKKFDKALSAFEKALEIAPSFSPARFNKAIVDLRKSDRASALSEYKTLKFAAPDIAQQLYEVIYSDKVISVKSLSGSKGVQEKDRF
jgi:tetratricopeptide (TPR) repeat protein